MEGVPSGWAGEWKTRRFSESATNGLLIGWTALAIVVAGASLSSHEAAAQTLFADSVGEMGLFGFVTWYDFTLTASDCIETRLLLNSIVQSSLDYGCRVAGTRAFDALFAPFGSGRYTLEISSTSTFEVLYTRSWNVPAIAMTASLAPTTATTGDTVVMSATFRLLPGGPDAYTVTGTVTVDAGSAFNQDVTLTLLSARDLGFWTGEATSAHETFTVTVPVSFGTAGMRSVSLSYQDEAHSFIETRNVEVSDPTREEVGRLRSDLSASSTGSQVLALLAIGLGLLGIVVGAFGILMARRALRAIAPPPPRPPAPAPMPATWPPEVPAAPPVPPEEPPGPPPSPPAEPPPADRPPPPGP